MVAFRNSGVTWHGSHSNFDELRNLHRPEHRLSSKLLTQRPPNAGRLAANARLISAITVGVTGPGAIEIGRLQAPLWHVGAL
jgi:hypothetical protein